MSAQPDLLLAFLAGIISFLSPCVFPLVPAYIGYLSGHALHEKEADQHYRETLK
ncbi:MAG TPA: cytochrome c biogenesis protein CcdA [Bellilinea sp.]|nr:cytochrome c biogenesis protein CcdA [Bellilinea sp.]